MSLGLNKRRIGLAGPFRGASGISLPSGVTIISNGVLQEDIAPLVRSSTATYVGSDGLIKTSSSNSPRVDYDSVSGLVRGLLVEESRTNLALRSEEFSHSTWNKVNSTIVSNAATSPDGNNNAFKMIDDSNNGHIIHQVFSVSSGVTFRASCFIKAAELNYAMLQLGGAALPVCPVVINLTTGETIDYGSGYEIKATEYKDGWWRLSFSALTTVTSNMNLTIYTMEDNQYSNRNYSGSGQGIYIWGTQLEQTENKESSYIPTTSSSVTRAQDFPRCTDLSNISFNNSSGTMYIEAEESPNLTDPPLHSKYFSFSVSGTSASQKEICIGGDGEFNTVNLQVRNLGGVDQCHISESISDGSTFKAAGAWEENNFELVVNGTSAGTDTSGTIPTVLDQLRIGRGDTSYTNTRIKNLVYYPSRLTQDQMIALTS